MNRFLPDTNTLSSLMQKNASHHAIFSAKFSSLHEEDEVYVSIVSLYEMEYGARHAKDADSQFAHNLLNQCYQCFKRYAFLILNVFSLFWQTFLFI